MVADSTEAEAVNSAQTPVPDIRDSSPLPDDAAAPDELGRDRPAGKGRVGLTSAMGRRKPPCALLIAVTVGASVVFLIVAVSWLTSNTRVILAIVVLLMGLVFVGGGVWIRLSGNGKRSRVVAEVLTDGGVALMTGAVVGLVLFAAQDALDEDRLSREVRRDNVRFVREVATRPNAVAKPFTGLDLRGARLQGLDLSDADLRSADLAGAELFLVDLSSARLGGANLSDALLRGADLSDALLFGTDLSNAYLVDVDLSGAYLGATRAAAGAPPDAAIPGANLRGADLTGADLTGARHNERTTWPDGFEPPPSA
jgi:hypothetical protein